MKPFVAPALVACLIAFPAVAAETTPAAAPVVETPAPLVAVPSANGTPAAPASPTRLAPRRMSPLAIAMAAVVESEQAQMATLKKRMAAAKSPAEAEGIQREVEQLKLDSEIQLLTLQATNHRQAGRLEAATRLDESIRSLRMIREASAATRPAPATTR